MRQITLISLVLVAFSGFAGETEKEEDIYTQVGGHYAASHILVQFRRAEKAPDSMQRSKKDAQAKAEKILADLQADPSRFEALARAESDGPSSKKGGYLGGFDRGDMAPKFEAMVKKLEEGELAPKVVKTGFGFHIIRREPKKQRNYGVGAILLVHNEANQLRAMQDNPEAYSRTKAEAVEKAAKAKAALATSDFGKVAESMGDLPKEEGFFGIFRKGEGPLSDALVDVVKALEIGAHSEVLSLPMGEVIIQRRPVVRYQAARIWISHKDAAKTSKKSKRSRQEAAELAEEIQQQLQVDPTQFEALAKKYSAGPFATRGGKMASWFKGLQDPAFEKVVAGLGIGEISTKPLETDQGFFITKRLY